jgi:hypothetical protein
MNVEIGTKATQFPEKECINGISVAVRQDPLENLVADNAAEAQNFNSKKNGRNSYKRKYFEKRLALFYGKLNKNLSGPLMSYSAVFSAGLATPTLALVKPRDGDQILAWVALSRVLR